MGYDVSEGNAMAAHKTQRERDISSNDIIFFMGLGGKHIADTILTSCEINYGSLAEPETKREKRLRSGPEVVVTITGPLETAGSP
jgi:hypothetical protein